MNCKPDARQLHPAFLLISPHYLILNNLDYPSQIGSRDTLDLVAQTSMRLSRLRQGAFSGLPRRGDIFGCVREFLLRRRVFRSSLAKTRCFAPFSAKFMQKAQNTRSQSLVASSKSLANIQKSTTL